MPYTLGDLPWQRYQSKDSENLLVIPVTSLYMSIAYALNKSHTVLPLLIEYQPHNVLVELISDGRWVDDVVPTLPRNLFQMDHHRIALEHTTT